MADLNGQTVLLAPQILAAYDDLVPGAAKMLIERADREQLHRHEMQRLGHEMERMEFDIVRCDVTESHRAVKRGQQSSWAMLPVLLTFAGWMIFKGDTGYATAILVALILLAAGLNLSSVFRRGSSPHAEDATAGDDDQVAPPSRE